MQGDLISRSNTIASLRAYAEQKHANGEVELANGILKAVCFVEKEDNIPTTYNLDAVVEQLENGGQKMAEANPTKVGRTVTHRYYKAISVKKAIDIVRNGGKE